MPSKYPATFAYNLPYTNSAGPYQTQLSPTDEISFQQWVRNNKIPWQDTPDADYDMRGFFQGVNTGDPIARRSLATGHFPDKWKTPYHQSFSNESIYAKPNAPRWNDKNQLIDQQSGYVVWDESGQ